MNATDSQNVGFVRRNATASSVRRQLVTATSNDVSWGSGQAANTPRIVAIKHTGTAVTVWDNSATTKAVNAVAQDTGDLSANNVFRLGAAAANTASPPSFGVTQCSADYYEIVIEDTARSDADIQQAITDMAAKWGITLT